MNNFSYIKKENKLKQWFRYHLIERKLNSFPGILLIIVIALVSGYLTQAIDYRAGIGLAMIFAVIFLVMIFIRYPYFGLYFLIAYSSLPATLDRLFLQSSLSIKFNNITDLLCILLFISVIVNADKPKHESKKFWKNPIAVTFYILFAFYFLEALNPNMHSLLGWVSFLRNNLLDFLVFYCLYRLLNSWEKVRYFIFFNIVLITLLAVYACKQQWLGVADFENTWASRPRTFALLFQGGMLRKWSTLSDPATSGVLFASVAVQCIILWLRLPSTKLRWFLALALFFNVMGYVYSGTRTATLMIVGGIAFYSLATIYEKRTMIFMTIAVSVFLFLLFGPYSPPSITRIRTSFQGDKDMSAKIRDINRHRIQPYLYQHPMGGGIFTCGAEGPKYNPGHYLETFPPDSGYTKIFAEQGMIGLAILLVTYSMIVIQGLKNFYRSKNPELMAHCIAFMSLLFSLYLGQYSQLAIGAKPEIYYYLGAFVFLIKLPEFDNHQITS
ncbi:MAG TPA: O-antigen ligase family protein [Puia sp.]|nr:O-antigen ligase family protein [Puia sp.]